VKIRSVPLWQRRSVELCTLPPGRWREIFDAADVVSEGAARAEGAGLVYYGTTSVLLRRRSAGGLLPDVDVERLAGLLVHDPHARLLALRIAHREAAARACGTLGPVNAELAIAACARGVAISVEVEARLAGPALRAESGGAK
jgi:hypothetical protein